MRVEGRGSVPPGRINVPVANDALLIIKDRSSRQAAERSYRARNDQWGRGLMSGFGVGESAVRNPAADSIYVGMVGEWGLCDFVNRRLGRDIFRLDMEPRQYGDGGVDFSVLRLSIQVKTRTRDSGVNLIRRADCSGNPIKFTSLVYVFCQYLHDHQSQISLLGWQWAKDLLSYPLVPAKRGCHLNVEIPDRDLRPMSRLIKEIEVRKEIN